jgi:hypothetical protein
VSRYDFSSDDVAAFLEHLASVKQDRRYLSAARMVRTPPGRPAIDDDAAIAEAENMFATGVVKSLNAGFLAVAQAYGRRRNAKSYAERLRRKRRKKIPPPKF